jgi:hypothetical protein
MKNHLIDDSIKNEIDNFLENIVYYSLVRKEIDYYKKMLQDNRDQFYRIWCIELTSKENEKNIINHILSSFEGKKIKLPYILEDLKKATKEEYEQYIDYAESKGLHKYFVFDEKCFDKSEIIYVDKEITIRPLCGAGSLELLVKKGLKINILKGHSHHEIFYMDKRITQSKIKIHIFQDMRQFERLRDEYYKIRDDLILKKRKANQKGVK